MSRPDQPKPFLPLVGGRSTFALTLARIAGDPLFGPVGYRGERRAPHAGERGAGGGGINAAVLLEPVARDTAAAIAAAAVFVAGADPFATLSSCPPTT